jgi:hypothetical protein
MLAYRSYTPKIEPMKRTDDVLEAEVFALPIGKKARAEHRFHANFVKTIIPDFCWQHLDELITMAAGLDENVNVESLKVRVCLAVREKILDKTVSPYKRTGPGGVVYMYKRRAS